jgi:hypothetical protein
MTKEVVEHVHEPTDEDHGCFVRHPDAGGQCYRPGVMRVYGLGFCAIHGPEAKLGAVPEDPSGRDYDRALLAAYPDPPEGLREQVHQWQLEKNSDHLPVFDSLLMSLDTLNKVMCVAHEADEVWLVEILEEERQSVAAQAAVALESPTPINH